MYIVQKIILAEQIHWTCFGSETSVMLAAEKLILSSIFSCIAPMMQTCRNSDNILQIFFSPLHLLFCYERIFSVLLACSRRSSGYGEALRCVYKVKLLLTASNLSSSPAESTSSLIVIKLRAWICQAALVCWFLQNANKLQACQTPVLLFKGSWGTVRMKPHW